MHHMKYFYIPKLCWNVASPQPSLPQRFMRIEPPVGLIDTEHVDTPRTHQGFYVDRLYALKSTGLLPSPLLR